MVTPLKYFWTRAPLIEMNRIKRHYCETEYSTVNCILVKLVLHSRLRVTFLGHCSLISSPVGPQS